MMLIALFGALAGCSGTSDTSGPADTAGGGAVEGKQTPAIVVDGSVTWTLPSLIVLGSTALQVWG